MVIVFSLQKKRLVYIIQLVVIKVVGIVPTTYYISIDLWTLSQEPLELGVVGDLYF